MVPILIMALAVVMTLEDLEIVSEVQVDEKIIPAIADLDVPLVMGSRLKKLSRQPRVQRRSLGTGSEKERWKTRRSTAT